MVATGIMKKKGYSPLEIQTIQRNITTQSHLNNSNLATQPDPTHSQPEFTQPFSDSKISSSTHTPSHNIDVVVSPITVSEKIPNSGYYIEGFNPGRQSSVYNSSQQETTNTKHQTNSSPNRNTFTQSQSEFTNDINNSSPEANMNSLTQTSLTQSQLTNNASILNTSSQTQIDSPMAQQTVTDSKTPSPSQTNHSPQPHESPDENLFPCESPELHTTTKATTPNWHPKKPPTPYPHSIIKKFNDAVLATKACHKTQEIIDYHADKKTTTTIYQYNPITKEEIEQSLNITISDSEPVNTNRKRDCPDTHCTDPLHPNKRMKYFVQRQTWMIDNSKPTELPCKNLFLEAADTSTK